jgi:hypothetical protein
MFVVCVGVSYVQQRAAERREAIIGARVYLPDANPQPAWYVWAFGDDAPKTDSRGYSVRGTEAGLAHLERLPQLRWLILSSAEVTDAGLAHLERLTRLRYLNLNGARITDAGLVHLEPLKQIQVLNLRHTPITDAGLVHLKGMTQLESLRLEGTQVSNGGVARLKRALPNCDIFPVIVQPCEVDVVGFWVRGL